MFQTLTGSFAVLMAMLGIIFAFALFMTAVLRWLFLSDGGMAEATSVYEPSTDYRFRKAA
jgi:hypothetical protein